MEYLFCLFFALYSIKSNHSFKSSILKETLFAKSLSINSEFKDLWCEYRAATCLSYLKKKAFENNPELPNLLLDPFFKQKVEEAQEGWRRVCATALTNGIPVPALTSALCYFDGFRSERLPANLLQAQRDYFGAHTYERVDKPRGEFFHTNWTGRGGDTASSTYNA